MKNTLCNEQDSENANLCSDYSAATWRIKLTLYNFLYYIFSETFGS